MCCQKDFDHLLGTSSHTKLPEVFDTSPNFAHKLFFPFASTFYFDANLSNIDILHAMYTKFELLVLLLPGLAE